MTSCEEYMITECPGDYFDCPTRRALATIELTYEYAKRVSDRIGLVHEHQKRMRWHIIASNGGLPRSDSEDATVRVSCRNALAVPLRIM